MRDKEAKKLKDDIYNAVCKKGMPINIRNGLNADVADYVRRLLEKHIQIDEPLGTIKGADYEHCPECNSVIGQSAFFCKICGAYIRQVKT